MYRIFKREAMTATVQLPSSYAFFGAGDDAAAHHHRHGALHRREEPECAREEKREDEPLSGSTGDVRETEKSTKGDVHQTHALIVLEMLRGLIISHCPLSRARRARGVVEDPQMIDNPAAYMEKARLYIEAALKEGTTLGQCSRSTVQLYWDHLLRCSS